MTCTLRETQRGCEAVFDNYLVVSSLNRLSSTMNLPSFSHNYLNLINPEGFRSKAVYLDSHYLLQRKLP